MALLASKALAAPAVVHQSSALQGKRNASLCPRPVAAERNVSCSAAVLDKATAERQRNLLSRRGWAATAPDGKLSLFKHEVGELGPHEVDIRVTHNGLCHTDIHMARDDWGASKFPFIPGHEVVGVVTAVGSQVTGLKPGDRAGVGWISDSCRCCRNCVRGEENLCLKGYTGLIVAGNHGGFQETCRVNSDFAYTIPDGLDSASAAPLLCAGITVYTPLRYHLRRPNMSVGVMGIGGLGHLALQFAAKMGAEVTAISGREGKEAEAASLGAHHFAVFPRDADKLKAKYDIIINTISSDVDVAQVMSLLKIDGTLVQVGIPGGNAVMKVPVQDLVFNQKRVVGSIVGGRADMQEMLDFCGVHGVRPMVETMPLSKVNEAMQYVLDGKARYRVVLTSDWA